MSWLTWAIASLLLTLAAAQTTDDLVGFFVSEAVSVYNDVTSAVGSVQAAASAASEAAASASSGVSDGASLLGASDFSSPSSTSSLLDFSSVFPSASAIGTSSTAARSGSAAAASETDSSATASASHSGNGGNNNLPIILGCVLGALALGLFILAILLCCRRRSRRRKAAIRARALSPDDHEVESWKHPTGNYHSRHGSNKELLGTGTTTGAVAAPLMIEHPAFRNHQQHENPFVPVPPPPRKSAPNARAGLTDGTVAGDAPYLTEKGTGRPLSRKSEDSSHKGRNFAMGAGGLALGAAAMHHHDKNSEKGIEVNNPYNRPTSINRKPVPANDDLHHGPWATPSTTANDDSFALSSAGGRRSSESSRSKRVSRDPARANTAFDNQYAPVPDQDDKDHHYASTAAALGAGALGGAALAHNHNRPRDNSRSRASSRSRGASRSRGTSRSHSQSPHRSLLLDAKHFAINDTNRNSDPSKSSNTKEYTGAVPYEEMRSGAAPTTTAPPSYATQGPFDVPPAPQTRSRRNSPLGMAAPAAAALSYVGSDHHDRPRERSSSRPRSFPHSPDDYTRTPSPGLSGPPAMPSRTPVRRSFPEQRNYSPHRSEPFPSYPEPPPSNLGPLSSSVHSAMSPYPSPPPSEIHNQIQPHHFRLSGSPDVQSPLEPYHFRTSGPPSQPHPMLTGEGVSTPGVQPLSTSTGIVGDDRYPHMNIPRRKSGGEYDYENDGQFLPQVLPLPPGAARDSKERSRSRSNSMSGSAKGVAPSGPGGEAIAQPRFPLAGDSDTSDDSAWRLSMGMPGGWQRTRSQSPARSARKSYESARTPVSPMDGYDQRDSNLSGSTAVTGDNGGRRLRLADLRREEEEKMRREGRKSMESEWVGSNGYGGYDERYGGQRYYDGHQGVGVAR